MNARRIPAIGATMIATCLAAPAAADDAGAPFVRLAELEVDAAQLESFRSAIRQGVETSVRVEPGVLALFAASDKDNPSRIVVFEVYTDAKAYAAHLETPHFRKFRAATDGMVKSRMLSDAVPLVLGAKPAPAPSATRPPAYYVAEFEVIDPEGIKPYSARIASTLEPYGGRFIVRRGASAGLEGDSPKGLVVIAFESMEKAQAWYESPAYRELRPIRHRAARARAYIVEGTGQAF